MEAVRNKLKSPVLAVAIIMIAAFMDLLDATIVSVAGPAIAADLQASSAGLQWTLAAYTLALGAGLVTGGRIGDQYGRRKIFLYGLGGFTLASLACAIAPSTGWLIAARVLQGLAGGMMIPQVFGIIRSSLTPGQAAKAYAAYGGVLSLASIAGPLLGGLLVNANLFNAGWRMIFLINLPVGIVAILLGLKYIPESQAEAKTKLDLLGALMISVTSLLVLLPLTQGSEWGWPWWSFALLLAALPVLGLFIRYERKLLAAGGQPILNPGLLKIRAFSAGLAASMLFFGAIGSFFFLLSLYLQLGTGRTALQTGLIIVPYAIGSILTSGISVQLAPKAGRALLVAGALVMAAALSGMLFVLNTVTDPGYWAFGIPLLVAGMGLGLTAPSLVNVILAGVPGREAGSASGVLSTIIQIGNAAGVAVLGLLFFTAVNTEFASGAQPVTVYTDAFRTILPWQIAIYLVAAACMLLLPPKAASQSQS